VSPTLSVVIPVYNVEAFLRVGVDSVLSQSGVDFEIIIVEDCSTDSSRSIARSLADGNELVRVVELDHNRGLGNARNVGMDEATGEWIIFLDSDDELTPGSLAATVGLGRDTDADLVMFDYARSYWDGTRKRNMNAGLFGAESGPVTTAARPDLLNNLNVAWNKLYHRSLLDRTGLRFPEGLYEDIPWTYPILLEANRIALLDRVVVLYRQRRVGSILGSPSPRHREVFDQYNHLFAWLATHPEHGWARDLLHKKMAAHLFTVFDHGERRVPSENRRDFYSEMSETVARHAPEGYHPSARLQGARTRFGRGYTAERARASTKRAKKSLLGTRRRLEEGLAERKGRLGTLVRLTYYRAQLKRPIDQNLALFSSYWYAKCSGNPKAIAEEVARLAPNYRRVWLVERTAATTVPEGDEAVIVGTWAYYRALATAKILVDNANYPNFVRHRNGTTHLQTQHGTPLKSMGLDLRERRGTGRMDFEKLMQRVDRWDYVISSNTYSTERWASAFPSSFRTLEYGYPRNDVFYGDVEGRTQAARADLGISDPNTTVMLYAPTFRDHRGVARFEVDLQALGDSLPDNTVLLVRAHYFDEEIDQPTDQLSDKVRDVSDHPDVQQLCLAADVLVTDYSSIMFDYANLGRPIIIYAPDWDTYRDVRGVYFDLLADPPGRVVRTAEALEDILATQAWEDVETGKQLVMFQATFCEFDDGRASERIVRRLFLGENLPDRSDDLNPMDRSSMKYSEGEVQGR
jgi:CDP-glycerol glycerophosphotransferase (TagB/SpsB family)